MTNRSTILLAYDEEGPGYVVTVPALPGCLTQGATVPEAIERAKEAITEHIAALIELGEDVPREDAPALMTIVEVESLALADNSSRLFTTAYRGPTTRRPCVVQLPLGRCRTPLIPDG